MTRLRRFLPFALCEEGLEAESRIDRPGKKSLAGKGTGFFVRAIANETLDSNKAALA